MDHDRLLLLIGIAMWVIGIALAVTFWVMHDPAEKARREQRRAEIDAQVARARGEQ